VKKLFQKFTENKKLTIRFLIKLLKLLPSLIVSTRQNVQKSSISHVSIFSLPKILLIKIFKITLVDINLLVSALNIPRPNPQQMDPRCEFSFNLLEII